MGTPCISPASAHAPTRRRMVRSEHPGTAMRSQTEPCTNAATTGSTTTRSGMRRRWQPCERADRPPDARAAARRTGPGWARSRMMARQARTPPALHHEIRHSHDPRPRAWVSPIALRRASATGGAPSPSSMQTSQTRRSRSSTGSRRAPRSRSTGSTFGSGSPPGPDIPARRNLPQVATVAHPDGRMAFVPSAKRRMYSMPATLAIR